MTDRIYVERADAERLLAIAKECYEKRERPTQSVGLMFLTAAIDYSALAAAVRELWLRKGGDPSLESPTLWQSEDGLFWLAAPPKAFWQWQVPA